MFRFANRFPEGTVLVAAFFLSFSVCLPGWAQSEAEQIAWDEALWANLMAGGAGVKWCFGYDYPHDDLTCEDWRSRSDVWAYTGHVIGFFHEHLPFPRSFSL